MRLVIAEPEFALFPMILRHIEIIVGIHMLAQDRHVYFGMVWQVQMEEQLQYAIFYHAELTI